MGAGGRTPGGRTALVRGYTLDVGKPRTLPGYKSQIEQTGLEYVLPVCLARLSSIIRSKMTRAFTKLSFIDTRSAKQGSQYIFRGKVRGSHLVSGCICR